MLKRSARLVTVLPCKWFVESVLIVEVDLALLRECTHDEQGVEAVVPKTFCCSRIREVDTARAAAAVATPLDRNLRG